MRRKRKIKKNFEVDPRYQNNLVAKFINQLMKDGKKSIAQKVFYQALDIISKKDKKQDCLDIFDQAVKNTSPMVEVKSRRIGGAHYQVPREVRGERRVTLAIRWLIKAAHQKKGQPMSEKLAAEFLDAAHNTGAAVKKKEETHRMAEANKAFAHFSW